MHRSHALTLAAAAVTATPVFAQTSTWQVDTSHTATQFAVKHMMVSTVRGHFGKTTGSVRWDGTNLSSAVVEVAVDIDSIETREPKRDEHLKSADFFDAAKHPTATFTSTAIEPAGPGKLKMTGNLTIRGVTRSVVFDVDGPTPAIREANGGQRRGATATAVINRKDFGILWNRTLDTGGLVVGDEVTLTIDMELVSR